MSAARQEATEAAGYDAGEASAVAERDRQVAAAEQRRADGLRYVLADRRGRDWLWALLEDCRIYASSYTGDQTTFFYEGMRNVGLKLLTGIAETAPEALATLMTENRSDDRDDRDDR